jgi:tetratricopeptide (TPR) repeat protein
VEVPWVDFAYNRNKALDLARHRADYSLFMDADQQFIPLPGFQGIQVDKNCYAIQVKEPSQYGSLSMAYFLVRNSAPIRWKGVLHEYLYSPDGIEGNIFVGGSILSITDEGNRSTDPQKYLKDAWVLEEALKKEPDNLRYMFYLGQSYMNAGENLLALKAFEERSQFSGEDLGETFFALYLVGILQQKVGKDPEICLESFLKAHQFKPSRHEPVYKIAQIYIQQRKFQIAYDFLKPYVFVYDLDDQYCVQTDIRDFLVPLLFACACYELKKYEESYSTIKKVLLFPSLPEQLAKQIRVDLAYMKSQIPYLE